MKFVVVGQVWKLSYGRVFDVFLLLERRLVDVDLDGSDVPEVEARWEAVRLSDGRLRDISEEWLEDKNSVKLT